MHIDYLFTPALISAGCVAQRPLILPCHGPAGCAALVAAVTDVLGDLGLLLGGLEELGAALQLHLDVGKDVPLDVVALQVKGARLMVSASPTDCTARVGGRRVVGRGCKYVGGGGRGL